MFVNPILPRCPACTRIADESCDHEIDGLLKAMDVCPPPVGMIVTEAERDTLNFGFRRIEILSFGQWNQTLS